VKKQLRTKSCLVFALLLLVTPLLLTSCGQPESTVKVYEPLYLENVTESVVADDGINQLVWDANEKAVFFYNTYTGRIWSAIPYDFYLQQQDSGYNVMEMKSPIHIAYYATNNRQERTITGYEGAILDGQVGSTLIENGIRVEYDFTELQLRIPVEYTLENYALKVSLDIEGIAEGDAYKLMSVSLAPYMASAPEDDVSYLFLPSGSGALMYTDVRGDIRKYSEPVFGIDAIEQPATRTYYAETAHLPIFGVRRDDAALLGIISKGAGLASIDAVAGDSRVGWACAYPTFQLRGSDMVDIQNRESYAQKVKSFSRNLVDLDRAEVLYQPLEGDEANYEGMANAYRQWLIDNQGLEKTTAVNAYMALEFLGGATVPEKVFGVSYDTLQVVTSLQQVQEILAEINSQVQAPVATVLSGFGQGGLDQEYLAGGYQIHSAFGSKEDLAGLKEWTQSHNGTLFTNFDLLYFRKNAYGVSKMQDVAYRANNVASKKGYYSAVTNRPDLEKRYYSLVKRSRLSSLADTLLSKFGAIDTAGIALNSLGAIAYSDYRDEATFARNGIEADVQDILNRVGEDGRLVMSGANSYAALASDIIWDSPFESSRYKVLDEEIPFYQMVFRGYVPMTSPLINREAEPQQTFLKALSLGVIPAYSVSATYPDSLRDTDHTAFANAYWEGFREDIIENLSIVNTVFPAIEGASITGYTKDGDLTVTEFDNGVRLFVNFGDKAVHSDAGRVEAGSYLLG